MSLHFSLPLRLFQRHLAGASTFRECLASRAGSSAYTEQGTQKADPNILFLRIILYRFSYYGFQVVLTNFISRPLPPGSRTGAIKGLDWNTPGALGKGQQAAFGITTFNTFWIYVTPILGAFIADTYWGRYKTVCVAIAIAIFGHIIMVSSRI